AEISAGRRSLARHFSEPAEGARGRRFASTTAAHFFRRGQGPGGGDGGPEPWGSLFSTHLFLFSFFDFAPLIARLFHLRCSHHCPPAENERSRLGHFREGRHPRQ